jgi:hypothetical protein
MPSSKRHKLFEQAHIGHHHDANLTHAACLVLNGAAACPVSNRLSVRALSLQPPTQLQFTLSHAAA